MDILLLSIFLFFISIVVCLWLASRKESKRCSGSSILTLPFTYGYFYVYMTTLIPIFIIVFAVLRSLFINPPTVFCVPCVVILGLVIFVYFSLYYFCIRRNRYALVILTILSFNIVFYFINFIYFSNRWSEFVSESKSGGLSYEDFHSSFK